MTRLCLPPLARYANPGATLPAGACDCHAHVFGPYDRYSLAAERSYTPPENDVSCFLAHLYRLGLTRGVLVTASAYGTDNRSVHDALRAHPERLRAVVVVNAQVSESELDALSEAGVRGARFNLYRHDGRAVYRNGVGLDDFKRLAPRLAARGWHAQIWIHAPDLPELQAELLAAKLDLVFDHMGRMSTARGVADVGFQALCRLVADGRAWAKISGADRNTEQGPPYDDVAPFVKALLAANPERLVWGTDWPHINYFDANDVPDDGVLLGCLAAWLASESLLHQILVANPAVLYGFDQVL